MGNQTSLTQTQVDEVAALSDFTPDEINRLFRRFRKLDTDRSGALSVEEFMAIPELEHNPLVRRVVDTFDTNRSGEVDFKEFIQALNIFVKPDAEEEKLKFTFKIYDVDGDDYISNSDLFQVLKAMVGNNLNDTQLQQLVDRTIRQGDKDRDGVLSFNEFKLIVMEQGIGITDRLRVELSSLGSPPSGSPPAGGSSPPPSSSTSTSNSNQG